MNKKMKIIIVMAVCVSMISLLLAGCAGQANPSETQGETTTESAASIGSASTDTSADTVDSAGADSAAPAGGRTIGVVIISGTNEHCLSLAEGAQKVIEDNGDKAVVLDANWDTVTEVECIESLIQQKVDGIVLEVTGQASSLSALKEAAAAGIPVAANDQWLAEESAEYVISQVATDNYMAGAMCGMDMIDRLSVKGNIAGKVMVIGVAGGDASNQRIQGFKDTIAKYPDIVVAAEDSGDGTIESAQKVVENLMQANTDIVCVFGGNDPCAVGALTAYKAAGKSDGVMFYGVDALPQALEFIKAGEMTATCKQFAYEMGKISAENIYKKINGEEISDPMLYLPVQMITSINVDNYLD